MRTWLALCFIRDRNGWVVTRFQMEQRRVGSDTDIRQRMRRVVATENTRCARIVPLPGCLLRDKRPLDPLGEFGGLG